MDTQTEIQTTIERLMSGAVEMDQPTMGQLVSPQGHRVDVGVAPGDDLSELSTITVEQRTGEALTHYFDYLAGDAAEEMAALTAAVKFVAAR